MVAGAVLLVDGRRELALIQVSLNHVNLGDEGVLVEASVLLEFVHDFELFS